MIDLAIVPVAGHGTRLLPATKSQPKEMLPVGRKPVVQHVVEELAASGIRRTLFVTGMGKTSIENHFDHHPELIELLRTTGKEELLAELAFERQPMRYSFTRQREQLGLGHAVLTARPFAGERPFVVALGDSIIGLHEPSRIVERLIAAFEQEQADAAICFEEVPWEQVRQYGIAQPRGEAGDLFILADLIEKPTPQEAPSNLAVAARYVFHPGIFGLLERTPPGQGGEIQLTDAIRLLIQEGGKVLGLRLPAQEQRYDIGNFESYFQAFIAFALADPKYGAATRTALRQYLGEST